MSQGGDTTPRRGNAPLRSRAKTAQVTSEELFFDLVYVFLVTQLSHFLLDHLTLLGAAQTLLLWFAVWLGWQYTAWVTNWFDPTARPMRVLLFSIMLVALMMAAALPQAFGERALTFAASYAAIQVGRSLWVLFGLPAGHALVPNFRRILAWTTVAGALWIAGALLDGVGRMGLWTLAVLCEYVAPMRGFAFPGLGRSATSDWTINGGHLAERCQLFVIVALGESLLASGVALEHAKALDAPPWPACSLRLRAPSRCGGCTSTPAARMRRMSSSTQTIRVASAPTSTTHTWCWWPASSCRPSPTNWSSATPRITWSGSTSAHCSADPRSTCSATLFKRGVYGAVPRSHLMGVAALLAIVPFATHLPVAAVGALASVVMVAVAAAETRSRGQRRHAGA